MEEKWESRLLGVFGGRRKKEKIKNKNGGRPSWENGGEKL